MNFDTIQRSYDKKLYNDKMVAIYVRKGVITKEEYKTITGKDYTK